MTISHGKLMARIYYDQAGDYTVPHVLNPRKLVFKHDLSPVKTVIGIPGKVLYLHETVYCACLSVGLVAFGFC